MQVTFVNHSKGPKPVPPFRATFPTAPAPADGAPGRVAGEPANPPPASAGASVAAADANGSAGHVPLHVVAAPPAQQAPGELVVESYVPPDPGPYPQDQPRRNAVRFTPVQVGAAPGSKVVSVSLELAVPFSARRTGRFLLRRS